MDYYSDDSDAEAELSSALKSKVSDRFEVGAVLRWVGGIRFTYAAIKCNNSLWAVTGNGLAYGTGQKTYEELVEILGRADVSHIEASVGWRVI